jgi:hypothetical protein
MATKNRPAKKRYFSSSEKIRNKFPNISGGIKMPKN